MTEIQHFDVLVDDSPPEVGVVQEGNQGSPDIDYTSKADITVSWSGFIDHKSGIKFYKAVMFDRCVVDAFFENTTSYNGAVIFNTTKRYIHVRLRNEGKTFFTLFAYNNAMSQSKSVCSDGVTLDRSPPKIANVTLQDAKVADSIACLNGEPYMINEYAQKVILVNTASCLHHCHGNTSNKILSILPTVDMSNDSSIAEGLCQKLSKYDHFVFYLPRDRIVINWNISDSLSQIADIFVGFGSDPNEKDAPDIIGYEKTNHSLNYTKHHTGLTDGTQFYIFIRVISKSSLNQTVTYGPVLIDETSPVCNGNVPIEIEDDMVQLSWTDNMFLDLEQTEPIGSILFQIGRY